MREQFFDDRIFNGCCFFAGVQLLLYSVASLLQRSEVGQHELGIYDFDVANWINSRADVMNVWVLKTTHHLNDRLDFADVMEELIAEAFTRAGAFHQARDVHKLDRCWCDLLRARNLSNFFEARIGDDHYSDVWVNCAERIIFRRRFVCACDRIEKGRLPDIWQPDNSST